MTYARWFDEGRPVAVLSRTPVVAAICPPDCMLGGTCEFCGEWSCPEHGVPEPGGTADETHVTSTCVPVAHVSCHAANCTDPDCWVN